MPQSSAHLTMPYAKAVTASYALKDKIRVSGISCALCIMSTVNNKGTALSTIPGLIDFKAIQTGFFTKEACRRPFLVMFFFAAVVRVAKERGQSRSGGRNVTDVAYQVQTICLQY
jgi:hypothetical protein